MNKILCVIVMAFLLSGCTLYKHVSGYEPQKFDYDPDNAYAEIVQRVNVPKGFYAEYTNHHYYIVDDGKIIIIDSVVNPQTKKEIEYNWRKFYQDSDDWTYLIVGGSGVMELNGRITFMMTLKQKFTDASSRYYYRYEKNYYHYPIFSVNTDGSDFCLSDITADITSFERLDNFYYDNDTSKLYVALYRSYDSKELHRYRYDSSSQHFVKEDYNVVIDNYDLTEFYLTYKKMAAVLYFDDQYEYWVVNRLTVFTDYASRQFQQVNMTHLGLRDKPLAVFCDEDSVWLYVTDGTSDSYPGGHYEFLKINCLGDVYPLKESL